MTRHLPTETRQTQILAAARRCILESGYHSTRMEDVARAAGLSKGSIYFHFQSKQGLLFALVEREFEEALRLFEMADERADPLTAVAEAFFGFLGAPGDPRQQIFVLTGELALHDEALRARLMVHHEALLDRLTALLDRAADEAGLRLPDPRATAVLLKAMADGIQGAAALGARLDPARLMLALGGLLAAGRSVSS